MTICLDRACLGSTFNSFYFPTHAIMKSVIKRSVCPYPLKELENLAVDRELQVS